MTSYTHIFKAPVNMLRDHHAIYRLLSTSFSEIDRCAIEMDDKQFFLHVTANRRMESELQQVLFDHRYNAAFVEAVEQVSTRTA